MRLEMFEFIDKTIALVDEHRGELDEGNRELEHFFEDKFLEFDNVLNVTSRVKTSDSIKEKIFRYNFYLKYDSPEGLITDLSDLIGLRIECRFIEDEADICAKIKKCFNIPSEEKGFYHNQDRADILLELDSIQPQRQKNGFEIYKIDGKYVRKEGTIRFELQIKSLVNTFWGEAEHKVLYKNYNYLLTEDLFKNIMYSLKENLTMVDKLLMILFTHIKDLDESDIDKRKKQLETILSKTIYDIYADKTKKEFGVVLDYRSSCDVIVSYILKQNGYINPIDQDNAYLKMLAKLYKLRENEGSLDEYIEFEREIYYEDEFCRRTGEAILDIINKDFKWNLFFKIIFQFEEGSNAKKFERFIVFLRDRFLNNLKSCKVLNSRFNDEEKNEITSYIIELIADAFVNNREIEFINDNNIDCINKNICITLKKVTNYEIWKENINYFTDEINRKLYDYK